MNTFEQITRPATPAQSSAQTGAQQPQPQNTPAQTTNAGKKPAESLPSVKPITGISGKAVPLSQPGLTQEKPMSYEDTFRALSPYTPPTPEQVAKEKKKQKREAIFAAIGDGISAISNLYFTTKGAPSMFDASKGASAAYIARRDKLKADDDARREAYVKGLSEARSKDDARTDKDRTWQNQLDILQWNKDKWRDEMEYRKNKDKSAVDEADKKRKFEAEENDKNRKAKSEQSANELEAKKAKDANDYNAKSKEAEAKKAEAEAKKAEAEAKKAEAEAKNSGSSHRSSSTSEDEEIIEYKG